MTEPGCTPTPPVVAEPTGLPRARQQQRFDEMALDHAAVGLIVTDLDGTWLRVNTTLRQIVGTIERESDASTFAEIVDPGDLSTLSETLAAAVAGRTPRTLRLRLRRADGSATVASCTLAPAPAGEPPTSVVVSVVPARYFASIEAPNDPLQQTLDERERWLEAIFEYAPLQIVLKDLDGRILGISGNVAEDLGLPISEFIGRTTADFLPPDVAAQYMRADQEVIETGRSVRLETVEGQGDDRRHYLLSKFPIRDADGRLSAICSLTNEITDLRQSEQDLRRAHDELELLVHERTAELVAEVEQHRQTAEELLQAKDAAERASRAKTAFLSSMSHELRTPMNAILGFAELIKLPADDPSAEMVNEFSGHIVASARHLMQLIEQVLDLGTIEAGHLDLHPERVEVASVVQSAISFVSHRAAAAGIIVEAELPDELPAVLVDETRARQVVLNLLTNAVKYNRPEGFVTIRAHDRGAAVRVSVADTGVGIPADRVGALFEPFERLGLESSSIEGTGIGLSITKALVDAMGGEIGVSSEVGIGSVFWVEFPLADRPTGAP